MTQNSTQPERALLFDYDGLLVDTESAEFTSWQRIYTTHGAVLELSEWLQAVGHVDNFNPRTTLEQKIGRALDWLRLDPVRSADNHLMVSTLPILPGARELMERGRAEGWRIAVVSNSMREWVEPGLERLGLRPLIDVLCTRGDAPAVKPDPAPYLHALKMLGAPASGSFAFEDSKPGIHSARAAGLTVIAIPNALTRHQDLSAAHQTLPSLSGFQLPSRAAVEHPAALP